MVYIDEATIHVIGRGPDKVFNSDYPTDSFIYYDPTNGSKSVGGLIITASRWAREDGRGQKADERLHNERMLQRFPGWELRRE